jgi:hypothetical protein
MLPVLQAYSPFPAMTRVAAIFILALATCLVATGSLCAQTLPRQVQFRPFSFQNPTFQGFSFKGQSAARQQSPSVRFGGIRFPGFSGPLKTTNVAANDDAESARTDSADPSPRRLPPVDVSDRAKVRNQFNEPSGTPRTARQAETAKPGGARRAYAIPQRNRMAKPGDEPPVLSARAKLMQSARAQRSERDKLAARVLPNTATAKARDNTRSARRGTDNGETSRR